MRRSLFILLLAVGFVGCDSALDADAVSPSPVTAQAEFCDPELGCDPPPLTCSAPPRPLHEVLWAPGNHPPGNYDVNTYLNRTGLDESPGNKYYIRFSYNPAGPWFTWSQYTTVVPGNTSYYYSTIVNQDPFYIRVRRVCPNGSYKDSLIRDVSDPDSYP